MTLGLNLDRYTDAACGFMNTFQENSIIDMRDEATGGKFCSHSTEFLVCVGNRIIRFDLITSHIMNRDIIILTSEIVDPIDMTFHVV